jgi:hypothetical protein
VMAGLITMRMIRATVIAITIHMSIRTIQHSPHPGCETRRRVCLKTCLLC